MRDLDARAMQEGGVPGVVLMENAGRAVFQLLCERHGPVHGRVYHVLCGPGNNGGDGFVVARLLALAGACPTVTLAGEAARIAGDARVMYELMLRTGLAPSPLPAPRGPIVDALLGTGARGAPRGPAADAIAWANASGQPIISADVPSGLDSDTGATEGDAVRADATVTFAYPKLGLLVGRGPDLCGELVVDGIGYPWTDLQSATPYRWIRPDDIAPLLPPRGREAHKGQFGHVLIVGGSRGMSGAVCLAARAALRAGAGLVTIGVPECIQPTVAACVQEAMTLALPEYDGGLTEEAAAIAARRAAGCTAVCIGPGLGRNPGAGRFVFAMAKGCSRPLVVDADALNAVADAPDDWQARPDVVLTPHPGECGRLLGTSAALVQSDRLGAVRRLAARYRGAAILKGAGTLVADGTRSDGGETPIAVNTTGNPGMATGGSGDALTGAIGAFLGMGVPAYGAACAGVYVHGRAGDLAAARVGMDGVVAGDIVEGIALAVAELRGAAPAVTGAH